MTPTRDRHTITYNVTSHGKMDAGAVIAMRKRGGGVDRKSEESIARIDGRPARGPEPFVKSAKRSSRRGVLGKDGRAVEKCEGLTWRRLSLDRMRLDEDSIAIERSYGSDGAVTTKRPSPKRTPPRKNSGDERRCHSKNWKSPSTLPT